MNIQKGETPVRSWLTEPLSADVLRSVDRLCRAEDVQRVALMPDVHLANEVCVGVAMATSRLIYPAAIGSDIGCGMAAVVFHAEATLLADESAAARVLAGLYRYVPAMKLRQDVAPDFLPAHLQQAALSASRLDKLKNRDGRYQLGTLGRGNHFVEFQADDQGRLWLMVHSGSRGMGQAIAAHHLQRAREQNPTGKLLAVDSEMEPGQAYLNDAAWAIAYAEENRLAIVAAVERLFQELFGVAMDHQTLIHSDHNHVRRETHDGQDYWVHRKGALPAACDAPGVIPGSMGTASFHVIGRGVSAALCSSSHGAGREYSRSEAARRIPTQRLEREMQGVWFDHRHASSLRDEAPTAYKDIHAVMRAQRELTRIVRELRPILSYKGV